MDKMIGVKFKDRLITEARINYHPWPEQFVDNVMTWCDHHTTYGLTEDTIVTPDEFDYIMDWFYAGRTTMDGTEY